jgi:hypothetical protein
MFVPAVGLSDVMDWLRDSEDDLAGGRVVGRVVADAARAAVGIAVAADQEIVAVLTVEAVVGGVAIELIVTE